MPRALKLPHVLKSRSAGRTKGAVRLYGGAATRSWTRAARTRSRNRCSDGGPTRLRTAPVRGASALPSPDQPDAPTVRIPAFTGLFALAEPSGRSPLRRAGLAPGPVPVV